MIAQMKKICSQWDTQKLLILQVTNANQLQRPATHFLFEYRIIRVQVNSQCCGQ